MDTQAIDIGAQSGILTLRNRLGMTITLNFANMRECFALMRGYGGRGWAPTELLPGGYRFPYAMADTFDFSLIGAREFTVGTGDAAEHKLEHLGLVYGRREYDEEAKGQKKKAKIKYSRLAVPGDPPWVREPAGDKEWVTLITFSGNAPVNKAYNKPAKPVAA